MNESRSPNRTDESAADSEEARMDALLKAGAAAHEMDFAAQYVERGRRFASLDSGWRRTSIPSPPSSVAKSPTAGRSRRKSGKRSGFQSMPLRLLKPPTRMLASWPNSGGRGNFAGSPSRAPVAAQRWMVWISASVNRLSPPKWL